MTLRLWDAVGERTSKAEIRGIMSSNALTRMGMRGEEAKDDEMVGE